MRLRLQLPSVHRKTWYFIFLIASLAMLMVLGAELSPSDNFDGIYRVMAFNTLLVAMLLINTADRRREYRTMQLSKVRFLTYAFTFTTFWWAVFRQAPLAGGLPGFTCTAAGVADLYPVGTTYEAPYTAMFWSSCKTGFAELVNYQGVVTAGKCCVDVPAHTVMNCSSGIGLVPDISQDTNIITSSGLEMYSECCPRMVGNIIPPGFTTMLLSACLGILSNIFFNAFKRTPLWEVMYERVIRPVARSEAVKRLKNDGQAAAVELKRIFSACKARVCSCCSTDNGKSTTNGDGGSDQDDETMKTDQDQIANVSDEEDAGGDVAPDDDDGGDMNIVNNHDASSPMMIGSADLPPGTLEDNLKDLSFHHARSSSVVTLQTCEYAFDRTVRSMLGVAAISSSPCGTFFAVTALHDDGMRNVGLYNVEAFKEQARPTVHFSLHDTLQIPNMVDVTVSPNERWFAGIHEGRRSWSLFYADDGMLLTTVHLGPDHPHLYGIAFGHEPFPAIGLVVCVSNGRLMQWTLSKPPESAEPPAAASVVDLAATVTVATGDIYQSTKDADEEPEIDMYHSNKIVVDLVDENANAEAATSHIKRFVMMGAVCVVSQRNLSLDWGEPDTILVGNAQRGEAPHPAFQPVQLNHHYDAVHIREMVAAPFKSLRGGGKGLSTPVCSPGVPPAELPAGSGGRGTPAWEAEMCNVALRDDSGNIYIVSIPASSSSGGPAHPQRSAEEAEEDRVVVHNVYASKFNRWSCIALSPDGNLIACGLPNGSVEILRRGAADSLQEFHHHADSIASVCFIGQDHVAVSGYDGVLTVVSLKAPDLRAADAKCGELSPGVAYKKMVLFPDGNRLACVSELNEIHVHNVGAMLSQSDDHASVPLAVSSCRPDKTVMVAVFNGVDRVEIREVRVDGSKYSAAFGGASDMVLFTGYIPARSVYLNPAGTILVVLCRDGSIVSYSLVVSKTNELKLRTLDATRQIGGRRAGPFHAMESVSLSAEGSRVLEMQSNDFSAGYGNGATTVVTVAIEKREHSYRLHLFQIQLPEQAKNSVQFRKSVVDLNNEARRMASSGTVVMNKIDLAEHLFSSNIGVRGEEKKSSVPLTAVAFTGDATKLCLWIGADVFVCDVDPARRTMQVLCVLHPSPLLKEEKIFQSAIRLKATGGALQIDHRHGGRVLRIIEHDQHFYVEEWHNVFRERDAKCVWLVDTDAKYVRFRSHLEVDNSTSPQPLVDDKSPCARVAQEFVESSQRRRSTVFAPHGSCLPPTESAEGDQLSNALPGLAEEAGGQLLNLDPVVLVRPDSALERIVEHSLPKLLEVYGYPKSKDPMQHAIRRGMNTLFPLLRTDELAQNSITAMLLPRGEGVITTAMCGTAFWPRESKENKNVTFEVSKFIVDMFQPSEFLVFKAIVATILGVISALSLVVNFDDYPMSSWARFSMFCASLCNGPIYSSVIDPISALTVHLHLQRSGLFPVAGGARATWQHLYADRNSFHKAYLSVGGGVFMVIMLFWFPGFVAVGPFFGSILIACAIVNIVVRLTLNSPLISVSNATANAECHRQFLAWLRHCLLFLLCLIDNININFFLQAIIRFPVNTGVILFGGAPYPFFPYVKSHTVGPEMGMFLNQTYGVDVYNIPEIPYTSMAGAAVAHVPFYMMQLSSGSCNAVRFSSSIVQQINAIFLMS